MRIKTRHGFFCVLVFAMVLTGVTGSSQAQSVSGSQEAVATVGECLCGAEAGTNDNLCFVNELCSNAINCATTLECTNALGPGFFCIAGVEPENCCGVSKCVAFCDIKQSCDEIGAGFCDNFEECRTDLIPTLSQWGIIILGLLLLTVGTIIIRRRMVPPRIAGSMLVFLFVVVGSLVWGYTSIQDARTCDGAPASEGSFLSELASGG